MCAYSPEPRGEKRKLDVGLEEASKRCHTGAGSWSDTGYSDLFLRNLAFPGDRGSSLPPAVLQKLEEDVYKWEKGIGLICRQSREYRNQALTLYHNPNTEMRKHESDEEKEEDLGRVSYYYPPLSSSTVNSEKNPLSESDGESYGNYQQQLMETGMMGVPPMNWSA